MSISALTALSPLSQGTSQAGSASQGSDGVSFGKILTDFLGASAQSNVQANDAIRSLALGDTQDLHNVTLAVAQADLNFRMILEMRNRLTEAFQEIMRMQV